eukprot:CAMPEP_0175041110 /NCGR_PEP_ID=MMETSP0052_2-20121109/1718_1 /TAXON_ID=51329 ORGANISM="Polytomella parva, Strain SAG 63-3" /NCGR_SAMPLE_ID=MMETSP0052_2 /ASSEMBLY_ACC=CAM_ASM_000194 /LENGTH=77 /DNA_ID=CAMNT_0016303559 /DNA_START=348 /DNA_END=578 /DNA_ORIENTATION=-
MQHQPDQGGSDSSKPFLRESRRTNINEDEELAAALAESEWIEEASSSFPRHRGALSLNEGIFIEDDDDDEINAEAAE